MTLLTIAQEILRETKSSQIPSSIIDNNQESAKQVLEALNIAIVNVARSFDWENLQKEYSFNSIASQESYALPTDFDRIIDNTFWNATRQRSVLGPTSARDWRILKNSTITGSTADDYFRIRSNEILLFPTPSAIVGYVVEYVSNEIVDSNLGAGQTGWLADSDVPNVDDYLVKLDATWRFLNMQGRPYAEKQREFDLALAERIGKDGGNKTIYHIENRAIDKSRIGYPTLIVAP